MNRLPFCPNCGSYVPLGNHSCDCGTTIGYDYEYDCEDDWVFQEEKRREILKRQKENPYDDDFFNDLHHQGVSPYLINRMNEGIQKLKDDLGVELKDADVRG